MDKFTLWDFFTYFFAGIAVLLFFSLTRYSFMIRLLHDNKSAINDFGAIIIFFSIPATYILGHIAHATDSAFGSLLHWISKCRIPGLKRISDGISVYRLDGQLRKLQIGNDAFWSDCNELQIRRCFTSCEYLYVLQDMSKGLVFISMVFTVISIFDFSWHFFLFLSLALLFWFRAKTFAKHFIISVRNTARIAKELNAKGGESES
jgi:hypothetical protein